MLIRQFANVLMISSLSEFYVMRKELLDNNPIALFDKLEEIQKVLNSIIGTAKRKNLLAFC